jgi:vacuolar-type H+-ATPase subunit E/Vma4
MKETTLEDDRLLEGIQKGADREAEEILKHAEEQIKSKHAGLERQLAEIRSNAQTEREKRLSEIRRRSDSAIRTSLRRMTLKRKEYVYNLVISEAEKELAARLSSSDSPEIIAKWIAEGVIGLGKPEVRVKCSLPAGLTPEILKKAAKLVKEHTGKDVTLHKDETLLDGEGVAMFSMDGRISFHNQISIRFRRYDQEVKKIIYDNLSIDDNTLINNESKNKE